MLAAPFNHFCSMEIRLDDLSGPEIRALLDEHLRNMHEVSPPESVHALDLDKLRQPDISFWTVWEGSDLLGCGALRALSPAHGEIKSMRTAEAHRGRGVARAVLNHIVAEAKARGFERLSLETGACRPSSLHTGSMSRSGSRAARPSATTSTIRTASS